MDLRELPNPENDTDLRSLYVKKYLYCVRQKWPLPRGEIHPDEEQRE